MNGDSPASRRSSGRVAFFFMIAGFSYLIFAPLMIAALVRQNAIGNIVAVATVGVWLVSSTWVTFYLTADVSSDGAGRDVSELTGTGHTH